MTRLRFEGALAVLVAVAAAPGPVLSAEKGPNPAERVTALEQELVRFEKRTQFVIDQYGRDVHTAGITELERRFSEAEIHFLLENYAAAVIFLYDVVESPEFQRSPRYDDALYYLAESLYRQGSKLPARGFFLELARRGRTPYLQDVLLRLIEISGDLQDYTEVDGYVQRLVAAGGQLRPEVQYVYGKFLFHRRDLPEAERQRRALQSFSAIPADGPFGLAARYFIGTLFVQAGRLGESERAFRSIVDQTAADEPAAQIQEAAWMSLGRVLYEQDKPDEAIDAYMSIDRRSDLYLESLYETAWAFVKKADFENALKACDILLVGAQGSPIAPKARLLMGHLHARARSYERAVDAYNEVIVEYAPVRDDIDALLSLHDDPIRYFNELVVRQGMRFDVEALLPPVAVQWASTEDDVAQALDIVSHLDTGREGIQQGEEIAARILAALDAGTLTPFPALAEGHARATELQTSLLALEARAGRLQEELAGSVVLQPHHQAAVDARRAEREALEKKFLQLPQNPDDLEKRTERWLAEVNEASKGAYQRRIEVQSLFAQMAAVRKLLRDTRGQVTGTPEDLEIFARRIERENSVIEALEAEVQALREEIARFEDAVRSGTAITGERELRRAYEDAMAREREAIQLARAEGGATPEAIRLGALQQRISRQVTTLTGLVDDIERRAALRREGIRHQVMAERERLAQYAGQVQSAGGATQDLVGRIALASVRRVRQQFYQLILRADVGIVDVAWARKTDQSQEIQRLAQEKDRQLRTLDRDFAEVLREAE